MRALSCFVLFAGLDVNAALRRGYSPSGWPYGAALRIDGTSSGTALAP